MMKMEILENVLNLVLQNMAKRMTSHASVPKATYIHTLKVEVRSRLIGYS